jgi:aryl-alcohol dehydrogenase-like predicted oxidoreductase
MVLDRGVNHVDVAPGYGEAEVRLNLWMSCLREKGVFFGCKTKQRTKDSAEAELHRSLERLGTERLDLYQLHAVGKLHELDECTAKGGALEALVEARASGIARWLGITGHTHDAPRTHLEALRRFDFDTVMFRTSSCGRNAWHREDVEAPDECAEDVGVHIIKTVARTLRTARRRATWYEPFTDQATIDRAVAFVLSRRSRRLPVGDVTVLPKALSAAERFRPLNPSDERHKTRERIPLAVRRYLGLTRRVPWFSAAGRCWVGDGAS